MRGSVEVTTVTESARPGERDLMAICRVLPLTALTRGEGEDQGRLEGVKGGRDAGRVRSGETRWREGGRDGRLKSPRARRFLLSGFGALEMDGPKCPVWSSPRKWPRFVLSQFPFSTNDGPDLLFRCASGAWLAPPGDEQT